jgi:hypothetical protein
MPCGRVDVAPLQSLLSAVRNSTAAIRTLQLECLVRCSRCAHVLRCACVRPDEQGAAACYRSGEPDEFGVALMDVRTWFLNLMCCA